MKTIFLLLLGALLGILFLPYFLMQSLDLPGGTHLRSPEFAFSEAQLLIDRTRLNPQTLSLERDHRIFDALLEEIALADTFLVADFFLWNPWTGALESEQALRPLANQLADALIAKRLQHPDMPMLVVTDPINRIYGEVYPEFFARLAAAGVPIVFTDLEKLPHSNRVYSPQAWFWRHFLRVDESAEARGRMSNPFDSEGPDMTAAQVLRLLHFKANHRKVLVTGRTGEAARLLIGSLNPADGSANHSNIAALVTGPVAQFAAESELEVARWSSQDAGNLLGVDQAGLDLNLTGIRAYLNRVQIAEDALPAREAGLEPPSVTYLSEGAIREAILDSLNRAVKDTRIDMAIFYFSDRMVVEALKGALERGARLRLLLDANRDAFGRNKPGIPNRPLAAELMQLSPEYSVEVRWAATHGEQYHAKTLRIEGVEQDLLLLGSANWTRRNLADLNLETNLLFNRAASLNRDFDRYFDAIWNNSDGFEESLPYETLAETGWSLRWRSWLYRIQEWSGASTF